MTGSLRGRLLLGSALLVVGLSTAFVVLFTLREVGSAERALQARGDDLADHLARVGRLGVLASDRSALEAPAQAALDAPGVLQVRYLDAGRVVYEGRGGRQEGRLFSSTVRVAAAPDDEGLELFGEPAVGGRERVVGTVEVWLDVAPVQARIRGALMTGGLLMIAFLLVGLGAAWLLSVRVLGPLSALTEGVRRLGQGDLERRVSAGGPSEVAALGRAYNEMAGGLQERTMELERQKRDLEEFVYIASHDLQSPLISIQGFAERLLGPKGPALEAEQRRWLSRIEANVETMGQLIRGILDLSRLNTRHNTPSHAPSRDLLDRALAPLRDGMDERGVQWVVMGEDWPEVQGDLPRLQAVFGNLVDNALKYLGDDNTEPCVEIGCDADGSGMAKFWVRDNGVGIDPSHQERIFRPLERLKTVDAHGIGMGLTLVRKIVETHGGELSLDSEPGRGSTFRFTLPEASIRPLGREPHVQGTP